MYKRSDALSDVKWRGDVVDMILTGDDSRQHVVEVTYTSKE